MTKKRITLDFEAATIERLDGYAKKVGVSRQKLISNLLEAGLDDLAVMDHLGVLLAGRGFRAARDMILKKADPDLVKQKSLF